MELSFHSIPFSVRLALLGVGGIFSVRLALLGVGGVFAVRFALSGVGGRTPPRLYSGAEPAGGAPNAHCRFGMGRQLLLWQAL